MKSCVYKRTCQLIGSDPKHMETSENPHADLARTALGPQEDGCVQNHVQH